MRLRTLAAVIILPAALTLVGCGPTAVTGGTQSKVTDAKGNEVKVDESLKVNAPVTVGPYTLKQGETKKLDFTLTRGKDLKDDVELSVEAPEKVKVEMDPKKVPASSDGKFTVTVSAAEDAAVAEHTVKLSAKTGKGNPAVTEFKVKVDKK